MNLVSWLETIEENVLENIVSHYFKIYKVNLKDKKKGNYQTVNNIIQVLET